MIRRILVPLDGSATSESVVPYVEVLQRCLQPKITLWQSVPSRDPAQGVLAYRFLSRVAERFPADSVHSEVDYEPAMPGILHAAQQGRYDLVAMCTRGHTGLLRVLAGSIARRMIAVCPIPLLVVPPAMKWAGPPKFRRILVVWNAADALTPVLSAASEIGKAYGARLVLLGVSKPGGDVHPSTLASCLVDQREKLMRQGLDVDLVLRSGDPTLEALDYAAAHQVDLVAMTSHIHGDGPRVGLADEVLESATYPLLLQPAVQVNPNSAPSLQAGVKQS